MHQIEPLSAAERQAHSRRIADRVRMAAGCVLVAVLIAGYGIWQRAAEKSELTAWTAQNVIPTVAIIYPTGDTIARTLSLPGDVEAFYEAPIFARVSGYLASWNSDIGARVKAGDVLAVIDTPELDQQLLQAQADLATAQANAALADITAKRWHALVASTSVSVQSSDEKQANAAASRAAVAAQMAHVQGLRAQKGFARLTAPFDGVVTMRNTDIGALVNAGAASPQALFKVADIHAMRIYVRVPQAYASDLAAGTSASLIEPQYPDQPFAAKLVTTSRSVDSASRTVLTELQTANPNGKLWPGTYATVKFDLPADRNVLRLPSSALIFRDKGAQVAVVDEQQHLHLKKITVARNLGDQIEVSGGISEHDQVVVSPLDNFEDGDLVRLARNEAQTTP